MMPLLYTNILDTLAREGKSLSELHGLVHDSGSTWSVEQLRLFLECMDGIEVETANDGEVVVRTGRRSRQEELMEAIEAAVRAHGSPLPAGEVQRMLAGRFVTSETQIRSLATKMSTLEIVGPGFIRLKQ